MRISRSIRPESAFFDSVRSTHRSRRSWRHGRRLLVLRLLGCLPLMNVAVCTVGRRPRRLRGGNRGPARLGGAAVYGESSCCGGGWVCAIDVAWRVSGDGGRGLGPVRGVLGLRRRWNGVRDGASVRRLAERHRCRRERHLSFGRCGFMCIVMTRRSGSGRWAVREVVR